MKTIKWIGAAALSLSAAFVTALALAAPGDRVVERKTPEVTLSGAQAGSFGTWAGGVFSFPSLAPVQSVQCARKRKGVRCESTESLSGTPAQFASAEDAADANKTLSVSFSSYNGSTVSFERRQKVWLNASQVSGLGAWVFSVDPSFPVAETSGITLRRDGSSVKAQASYSAILSPTQYVEALEDGLILKRTGTVQ